MDIAKFNKELAYRVAKATGLENNNKINEAIEEWVAISELVIHTSKTPNLEFSYKSMLIDRTKQIIEHIKVLKLKLTGEKRRAIIEDSFQFQEDNKSQSNKIVEQLNSKGEEVDDKKSIEYIEESEFKNLPKGFKEIKATKDFEIITPHDNDYIKKILVDDHRDMPKIKENQSSKDQDKIICFACGVELSFDTRVCPKCGTPLKK